MVGKIWVTANNQIWAAEVTGLSLEDIRARYKEARRLKVICSIETDLVFPTSPAVDQHA